MKAGIDEFSHTYLYNDKNLIRMNTFDLDIPRHRTSNNGMPQPTRRKSNISPIAAGNLMLNSP